MKKLLVLLLALALVLSFAACGATDEEAAEEAPAEEAAAEETAAEETPAEESSAVEGINHIVLFESNVADLEATDVNGVQAYSVADFIAAKLNAPTGAAKVVATDGYAVDTTVEDISSLYITLDGDNAPVFVGEDLAKELTVKNMLYIAFENEAIYFVESDFPFADVMTNLGLSEDATYTFTASDAFAYDAVDLEDAQKAEVKCAATTGNLVNVFFYSMGDKGADLRECVDITLK